MLSEGAGRALLSRDRTHCIATGSARAGASRANGRKSKGPKTAEGKARASRNALRHGLCAKKYLLLPDDSRAQFAALETALLDDLSPQGALQTLLAHRLIAAAWRLQRADRLELDLFRQRDGFDADGGLLRGRDVVRAFPTLVRYRNAAQAEFFRALKALEAARKEAARNDHAHEVEVELEVRNDDTHGIGVEAEGDVVPRLTRKRDSLSTPLARKRDSLSSNVDGFGRNATPNEPERPPRGQENDGRARGNEPERAGSARPAAPGAKLRKNQGRTTMTEQGAWRTTRAALGPSR